MVSEYIQSDLTRRIIGAAYEVHKHLGPGFLESVYVAALVQELNSNSVEALTHLPIPVRYKGVEVGNYFADIS